MAIERSDLDQIEALADLAEKKGLSEIEIRVKDRYIRISRGVNVIAPAPEYSTAPDATTTQSTSDDSDGVVQVEGVRHITSPIVGTFYEAPSPESPRFVEVGNSIKKGQVVCIIEAMKLMNEIESEVDGVVTELLVENAQGVEFGQPLFSVQTN